MIESLNDAIATPVAAAAEANLNGARDAEISVSSDSKALKREKSFSLWYSIDQSEGSLTRKYV